MADYVTVAREADLVEGVPHRVEVEGHPIMLLMVEGTIHALDDTCTHAYASLSLGHVDGHTVTCPLHFASFDVRTGGCTGPPADEDVATWSVRVLDDEIQIAP